MILRSLKLVHFQGVQEFAVADASARGLVPLALPDGAPPRLLSDALRFAVTGRLPEGWEEPDRGFATVEVGLKTAQGEEFSLFRGVDARGRIQGSLREADGPRLLSTEPALGRRFEQLCGAPAARWLESVAPGALPAVVDLVVQPAPPRTESTAPSEEPGPDVSALRTAIETASAGLFRAFRAAFLDTRAQGQLEGLVAFGGRLRHERAEAAVEVGRLAAERERVRSRLRRLGEYRALLEQARPPTAGRAAPHARVELGLAALVAAFLVVLVWLLAGNDPSLAGAELRIAASLGLAVSVTSFLLVSVRRRVAAPTSAERGHAAWRDALRRRFRDLDDPDDPSLPATLRGRLAGIESDMGPGQTRLERLDEALALHDVELGRACRALHCHVPASVEGRAGFAPDEDVERAEAAISALGDAIFQATAEREALLAGGAPSVEDAVATARDAVGSATALWGDRPEPATFEWGGLLGPVDAAALVRVREVAATLDAFAASLDEVPEPAEAPEPEPETAPPAEVETIAARVARSLLGTEDAAWIDAVATVLGAGGAARLTGGQWTSLRAAADGALELDGPMGAVALHRLPSDLLTRLRFGLRLACDAEIGVGGGLLLFDDVPVGFTGAEDLAHHLSDLLGPIQLLVATATQTPAESETVPG